MRNHNQKKRDEYECPLCDEVFSSEDALSEHLAIEHENPEEEYD